MPGHLILVKAAFDVEAGVWFVESSDILGLNAEAATIEDLVAKLPGIIADLADSSDLMSVFDNPSGEYSIEVIAHATTRVRLSAAA